MWLIVLGFTGVIALPALFTTPGRTVATVAGFAVTEQGLRTASLLILRVETAVTFTTLLILCTPWAQVLKALRALRLPKEVVMMLAMTLSLYVPAGGDRRRRCSNRAIAGRWAC